MTKKIVNLLGSARDLAEFVMLEVQIGSGREGALERIPIEYED